MLALVLDGTPRLVRDYPAPDRHPGEALVEVRLAGVCDTDLQLARGYMGYRGVLGHEFVGEVIEADDPAWRGKRVVADINAGCGVCEDCTTRGGHHCATRTVLGILGRDGALAERCVVPARCLVEVPDAVADDRAVFAEPLAAALHVLDDLGDAARERVVVLGDGKLGLLVAHALRASDVDVLVVGHHTDKLGIAASAGAETCLERDLDGAVAGVGAVIEATGSAAGVARALSMVRPRGTVVLKTTVAGATQVDLSPVVVNELRVVGSRCGDMRRAIDVLASGRVDPRALVAARYPLADAEAALARAAERGTLKVLVEGA